jgi:hypothetical protein
MIDWLLGIYEPYDPEAAGDDPGEWWREARPCAAQVSSAALRSGRNSPRW